MAIIQFKDAWEMFRIKFIIDGKVSWENFWALKGVSFEVEKGETLGIIGENGAGKSTILKLIAGMLKPDRGEIKVQGKVSGLLELGAGFQSELTGRENIYLSASLFGLTQNQIEKKYENIVNFASLGKFINAPVKCYSQGMFVRLAFAIAIHMEPDILLIDDTLAVGDEYFQRKCIKKIFELKEQDRTIILVTHDMNMLRRLCQRTIFIKEGKIIKDDISDKAMPLYTQMIGTTEGVGVLEKKPLTVVFNNGRLFLNWQDKLLTPNPGAYTALCIGSKWYSSSQADWVVKRRGENKLVATGKFYQLMLTQIWQLELTDNYEIKWDIEIELEEPLEIQDGHTNIMLTNEYVRWFTNLEKGEFPFIDDKDKNWQPLLEGNTFRKCIGVESEEISGNKIPSLVFEQSTSSHQNQAQISNTDYFTNCRVLQYKTMGLQDYLADQFSRFIYFSGKININISDINNYLKNLQDEFTLSSGKLRLIFDNGRYILYYDGINLTKVNYIGTCLYVNGRWYSSNLAHWEIKKQNKNKIIAKAIWPNLPIVQIWETEITSESSFLWKVNMEVNEEVDIPEQQVRFMCSGDYKYYFSDYGRGNFPEDFLEVEMDMLQRCIPDGIIGLESQNNQLPVLFLKFSRELNNFSKIFNSDFYYRARVMQIERVESEEGVRFLPGEYSCFKIETNLNKGNRVFIKDSASTLESGKLKFVFDKGRDCIYWDGFELTKRLGLYTSLRSQGRWFDSASSAIWKIEKKNKDIIEILGKWLHLPINQCWEIRLRENSIIEFNVKLKVDKKITVDRMQTNIMLSENYKEWLANDKDKGSFPAFKGDIDDEWEILWSEVGSIEKSERCIGVLKNYEGVKYLPTVKFFPQNIDSGWHLNIINADLYHRGRVLQYLKKEEKTLLPGYYSYFKGKIVIEET